MMIINSTSSYNDSSFVGLELDSFDCCRMVVQLVFIVLEIVGVIDIDFVIIAS